MFKLCYDENTPQGWSLREALFTANEEQTAREVAASLKANRKMRGVTLYDFRPAKARKRVPVLEQFDADNERAYAAKQVGTALVTSPACEVVDLTKVAKKSPARKAKVEAGIGVEAAVFTPAKPRRVSKQARTYADMRAELLFLAD